MTDMEFDRAFEAFELDTAYAEFLMVNSDRPIYNGDSLIRLQEGLYMYEDFRASLVRTVQ
jgi:hypothetical protein